MGVNKAFVIGPMCVVNRISAEPPSHIDCARFAVRFCPFLALPNARRREANLPEGITVNPEMLPHNPGVTVLWVTRSCSLLGTRGGDHVVFRIGEPLSVQWFREGRAAMREECVAAFRLGLPKLIESARAQYGEDAVMSETDAYAQIAPYLPAADGAQIDVATFTG